ncbi:MAG: septum formation initiator family protein [Candidatus Saccharibacteria bacterium]
MKTKIHHYEQQLLHYMLSLRDPRTAGQLAFVIIVLLISWSGVKAIQTNYALQQQIVALQQQNSLTQLQDNNQKLSNEYYNSDQYLELAARENFGLAAPGEKELIVPRSVALANTSNLPVKAANITGIGQVPAYQNNFQAWLNFFMHRQSSN